MVRRRSSTTLGIRPVLWNTATGFVLHGAQACDKPLPLQAGTSIKSLRDMATVTNASGNPCAGVVGAATRPTSGPGMGVAAVAGANSGSTTLGQVPSSNSLDHLIHQYLVPKYVSTGTGHTNASPGTAPLNRPLARTRQTMEGRALEIEMFRVEKAKRNPRLHGTGHSGTNADGDVQGCHRAKAPCMEFVETGVLRWATVPANFSLAHLSAFVCYVMGWPVNAEMKHAIRQGSPASSCDGGDEYGYGGGRGIPVGRWSLEPEDEREVWMVLVSPGDSKQASTTGEAAAGSNASTDIKAATAGKRPQEKIRLSEIWPLRPIFGHKKDKQCPGFSGLDDARPRLTDGNLCVRIKCVPDADHSFLKPSNEPVEITGLGAPPASFLPVICDFRRPLQERWASKRFEGKDFMGLFWEFVRGSVITEVDVQGVWLWHRCCPLLLARLAVLQRRSRGDWVTDIEEDCLIV